MNFSADVYNIGGITSKGMKIAGLQPLLECDGSSAVSIFIAGQGFSRAWSGNYGDYEVI